MIIRSCLLLIVGLLLGACSVTAYTPVVASSALGLDRNSLRGDPRYSRLIGTPIQLRSSGNTKWSLRKFSGGRYFIELSQLDNISTPLVCYLEGKEIIITNVFEDMISGGIYFSATAKCSSDKIYDAPKNYWYDDLFQLSSSKSLLQHG